MTTASALPEEAGPAAETARRPPRRSYEATGRAGRLVVSPGFGRFYVAVAVSALGDWLTLLAIGVVVYRITGSTAAPAALILVRATPRLVGPAIGGALADRMPVVRALAATLAAQGLVTATLIPAIRGGAVWAIYVAVAAAQLLGAAARPMFGATIARFVSAPSMLSTANSFLSLTTALAMLVAPAAGVGLLAVWDADRLIVLDVLSFALAVLLLTGLRPPRRRRRTTTQRSVLSGLAGGLRPVLGDPVLRLLTAAWLGSALLVGAVQSSVVVIAADRFGGDSRSGYLLAAVGVGGVLGALFTLMVRPQRLRRTVIVLSFAAETVPLMAVTVAHRLVFAVLLLGLSSAGAIGYQAWGAAELARRLPPTVIGRGNAVVVFALYVGSMLGTIGAVVLIPLVGWVTNILVATGIAFMVVACGLLGPGPSPPVTPSPAAG